MYGHQPYHIGIGVIVLVGICEQGYLLQVAAQAFIQQFAFFIGRFCKFLYRVKQLLYVLIACQAFYALIVIQLLHQARMLADGESYIICILLFQHGAECLYHAHKSFQLRGAYAAHFRL